MSPRILLCGADEYLGGLFVAEAVEAWAVAGEAARFELLLSGRDAAATALLAAQHGLALRPLDWALPVPQLAQQLDDIDVVVNAGGPFGETPVRLAQAAISAGCHCVDLSAEVRVYRKLEALAGAAATAQVAVVRSAGPGAAASALMVNAALRRLVDSTYLVDRCVGAVRLALQCVADFSRGSAGGAWAALARDVTVVRAVAVPGSGGSTAAMRMRIDHVPIGALERQFDFAVAVGAGQPVPPDTQIASAADLVDTLAASAEVERAGELAGTVESYVSATSPARIAYPLVGAAAALAVPLLPKALADLLASTTLQVLPDGPSPGPGTRHTIVLEIEDEERTRIVDWRLDTPDFYLTGARCAVAIAEAVAAGGYTGLLSPAQVLSVDLATDPPGFGRALRDCRLDKRVQA